MSGAEVGEHQILVRRADSAQVTADLTALTRNRPGVQVSGSGALTAERTAGQQRLAYDARGTRECSWLKLRGLSDRLKYRTVTYRNCSSSRPRAFSVNFGYALKAQAKVWRGSSTRITGKCSPWASVWRQGGY
ncbi:hypothetical protein ACQP1V_02750 [Microtetraspora malaysiensis]|uniref:hypothetical protein n=1 Tax=Microtetraspora malaysiensis TaxID=161358 RepID=UPI003D8EC050